MACLRSKMPKFQRAGMRVAIPTTFLIFDSYDMKSLWSRFGCNIFTGFKTASPFFKSFYELKLKTLKSWHFEASEDVMTKFKSQALHIIQNQILKCWWEWQPSLLHFILWKIDILFQKQATQTKHFDGESTKNYRSLPFCTNCAWTHKYVNWK